MQRSRAALLRVLLQRGGLLSDGAQGLPFAPAAASLQAALHTAPPAPKWCWQLPFHEQLRFCHFQSWCGMQDECHITAHRCLQGPQCQSAVGAGYPHQRTGSPDRWAGRLRPPPASGGGTSGGARAGRCRAIRKGAAHCRPSVRFEYGGVKCEMLWV